MKVLENGYNVSWWTFTVVEYILNTLKWDPAPPPPPPRSVWVVQWNSKWLSSGQEWFLFLTFASNQSELSISLLKQASSWGTNSVQINPGTIPVPLILTKVSTAYTGIFSNEQNIKILPRTCLDPSFVLFCILISLWERNENYSAYPFLSGNLKP